MRWVRCLPLTSFRFRVATDTLVSLAGRFPLLGLVRDLHPLDNTHASQTKSVDKNLLIHGFFIPDGRCLLFLLNFLFNFIHLFKPKSVIIYFLPDHHNASGFLPTVCLIDGFGYFQSVCQLYPFAFMGKTILFTIIETAGYDVV